MIHRPSLATALALAVLLGLAPAGTAQDAREGGDPAPAPAPAGGEDESIRKKVEEELDTQVDVKGVRFKVTLKNGSVLLGVMPRGLVWEKADDFGSYRDAKTEEKGSGIRLYYVLGLDGQIFISLSDIARNDSRELMVRDLGELTEAQKAEIRDRILNDRRKVIQDREIRIREELARIAAEEEKAKKGAAGEEAGEEAGTGTGTGTGTVKPTPAEDEAAEDAKKGDALLAKFPSPDWSETRLKDILRREVINGIFRNDEEREFIDGFKLWKEALERKQAAEAEEKGG